jgi:diguanylate cyclase (GGDEF)-like protein
MNTTTSLDKPDSTFWGKAGQSASASSGFRKVWLWSVLERRLRLIPAAALWSTLGLGLMLGIGMLDIFTDSELSFSLFYFFPISLVTWYAGRRLGVAASITGAFVWLVADLASSPAHLDVADYVWNSILRCGFFIIVTLLLVRFQQSLENAREMSRTDYLTGAVSTGFFYSLLQMEIDRFKRYRRPFSVAYIDLDNFKAINDRHGHSMGDMVLRTIANQSRSRLRKTDVFARLGGDEFAILFPETDQAAVQAVIQQYQRQLLTHMENNNWPVTFSIGVMTFNDAPDTPNELIKLVDHLMYEVKKNGKNAVRQAVYQ